MNIRAFLFLILVCTLSISYSQRFRILKAGRKIKQGDEWSKLEILKSSNELVVFEPMKLTVYSLPKHSYDFLEKPATHELKNGTSYFTHAVDDRNNECSVELFFSNKDNSITLRIIYESEDYAFDVKHIE